MKRLEPLRYFLSLLASLVPVVAKRQERDFVHHRQQKKLEIDSRNLKVLKSI